MANTVYVKENPFTPALDSNGVAKRYEEQISIIAECINKLTEVENVFEYLTDKTCDNGDPHFMMQDALKELGKVLAIAVSYKDEYYAEASDESKDDKDEE